MILTNNIKVKKMGTKTIAVMTKARKVSAKKARELFEDARYHLEKDDQITKMLRCDLFHSDKQTGTSVITTELDRIMEEETEETIQIVKEFVRKRVQTLIKEKSVQTALLGENYKNQKITIKRVTNPMVENTEGRFEGSFNEVDKGKFRVVVENKPTKPEDTLEQSLIKWMDAHEVDTTVCRELLSNIDNNLNI